MSEMQGKKLDQNKPRMSLLPKGALNAVIRVLEFGARKYTTSDFFCESEIERLIGDALCQNRENVNPARKLGALQPKVYVQHVIEKQAIQELHAQAAKKKSSSHLKMDDAVFVTSVSELSGALIRSKLVQNIKKNTDSILNLESVNVSEIANVEAILNMLSRRDGTLKNETLRNMDSRWMNISICVGEGVRSAEVQSVHILTTIITQGNFVTSFVVNAIKLSDCYRTLLMLLEHCFGISVCINEISKINQGRDNWKHVPDAKTRYYDAMQRHIDAWWQGEKKDSETGESHLAHAVCCALFLMWLDDNSKRDTEACSWKNESLMTQLESITKRDKEQSQ